MSKSVMGKSAHRDRGILGLKLRGLRKRSGFTQAEVAANLGIDQSALSRLERREDVLVSTLCQYVDAVGAPLRIDAVCASNAKIGKNDAAPKVLSLFGPTSDVRRDIVLSIKPEYAQKILAGEKTVELRRRFPQVKKGTIAVIYTTSPTRAITGVAEIEEVEKLKLSRIWKELASAACIEKADFDRYFAGLEFGCAIKLGRVQSLNRSWKLSELRSRFNFAPPQSFLYATPQLQEALKDEFSELFN